MRVPKTPLVSLPRIVNCSRPYSGGRPPPLFPFLLVDLPRPLVPPLPAPLLGVPLGLALLVRTTLVSRVVVGCLLLVKRSLLTPLLVLVASLCPPFGSLTAPPQSLKTNLIAMVRRPTLRTKRQWTGTSRKRNRIKKTLRYTPSFTTYCYRDGLGPSLSSP